MTASPTSVYGFTALHMPEINTKNGTAEVLVM
jgi:hypothetical protein